jgi:hypothetical protein
MSLIFTHHDSRTQECDHDGMLGRPDKDGARMCVCCGATVKDTRESFTEPGQRATSTPR